MPAIIFSSFASPISSMPSLPQTITHIEPLGYFLVILRGVYLKGLGSEVIWEQMAVLGLVTSTILAFRILRFRKSLD